MSQASHQASSKAFKRSRAHSLAMSGLVFYLVHILQQAQARDTAVLADTMTAQDDGVYQEGDTSDAVTVASVETLEPVFIESTPSQSIETTVVVDEEETSEEVVYGKDAVDVSDGGVSPLLLLGGVALIGGGIAVLTNDDNDSSTTVTTSEGDPDYDVTIVGIPMDTYQLTVEAVAVERSDQSNHEAENVSWSDVVWYNSETGEVVAKGVILDMTESLEQIPIHVEGTMTVNGVKKLFNTGATDPVNARFITEYANDHDVSKEYINEHAIWQDGLLAELYLDSENFSELPKSLVGLKHLDIFSLQGMNLEGLSVENILSAAPLLEKLFINQAYNVELGDLQAVTLNEFSASNADFSEDLGIENFNADHFPSLTHLGLRNTGVEGEIKLGELSPDLESLILASNTNLTGNFDGISQLDKLESIEIGYSGIVPSVSHSDETSLSLKELIAKSSQVDDSILSDIPGTFPNLMVLDLSYNALTSVPDFSELLDLEDLILRNNDFSAAGLDDKGVSEIWENVLKLSATLTHLNLGNSGIDGLIPHELNSTLFPVLNYLRLSFNGLDDEVPEALFEFPEINYLSFHQNEFSDLPSTISSDSLETLYLSKNQFEVAVPQMDMPSLKTLGLYQNDFYGTLDLTNLVSLENLNANNNDIESIVFDKNTDYSDLWAFSMNKNNLTMPFSELIEMIPSSLERLNLYGNSNMSPSPLDGIEKLVYLRDLNVQGINLTGTVDLSENVNLVIFNLSSNNLTGALDLTDLGYLQSVNVGNNDIESIVFDEDTDYSDLRNVWLPSNELSMSFESFFKIIPPSVIDLNVQNNGMYGGLDGIEVALPDLRNFYGDANQINAPLPDGIADLDQLNKLSLWQSGLTGPIPEEIGQLKKLGYLNLNNNSLEGSVPSSMIELLKEYDGSLSWLGLSGNTDLNWGTSVTIDGEDITVLDLFKASQGVGYLTTFEYDDPGVG